MMVHGIHGIHGKGAFCSVPFRVFRGHLLFVLSLTCVGEEPRYAYPQPGKEFTFPRDHGSHPDFKIEWWYITGHLFAEDGKRFGFQATFFREAGGRVGEGKEAFADAPFYLAHMALLDVATQKFIHQERLNRSGWDAASSTETLDVRNGNWSLRFTEQPGEMELVGSIRSDALLRLKLKPSRPLVVFGKDGVSRKGADPQAASYYLTFPRLATSGTLRLHERDLAVKGEAWMDHEISSSQLTREQVGWDWACLQLHDGRSIMAYRMRLEGGASDPFSTLAWIDREGPPRHTDRFTWKNIGIWKSPHTGAVYPAGVEITDPAAGRTFRLVPLAPDQELHGGVGGVAYWEGACRVLDEQGKEIGSAFLELTGYAARLKGVR